jgi:hypothetical protein
VVVGLAWLHAEPDRPIRISPTAPRPGAAGNLAELRSPVAHIAPVPVDPFADVTITDDRDEHEIAVTIGNRPNPAFTPDFDVHESSSPGGWVSTPDGRVRLVAIGLAQRASPTAGRSVPVRYYDPVDLSPVAWESLPESMRRRTLYLGRRGRPTFLFIFELDGFDHPDPIGYGLHDAHTQAKLTWTYGYSSAPDAALRTYSAPIWHGPAAVLSMDLAHGPLIEHRLRPEAGRKWRHGPLHVEVLGRLARQPIGPGSSMHSSRELQATFAYHTPAASAESFGGVLVGVLPINRIGGLDMGLLDADGAAFNQRGDDLWFSGLRYLGARVEADQIAWVRVRWRPHFKRIIWHLPALPAALPANQGVTDLLHVTIPSIELELEHDWVRLLEDALQIEIDRSTLGGGSAALPAASFPRTYEDVTLGQMLDEYLSHVNLPPGHVVVLDEARMVLTTRRTRWQRLKDWVGELF